MTTLRRLVVAALAAATLAAPGAGCVARVHPHAAFVVDVSPPRPRPVHVAPRVGWVWVQGHWAWIGARWVWTEGYWQPARHGHIWVEGRWLEADGRWRWIPGHWE